VLAKILGDVKLSSHLHQQTHINNPRSQENSEVGPNECQMLGCNEVQLAPFGSCINAADFDSILSRGDSFDDGGNSLKNLIHQSNSLNRLGNMIET
jgi:hypothetical protein